MKCTECGGVLKSALCTGPLGTTLVGKYRFFCSECRLLHSLCFGKYVAVTSYAQFSHGFTFDYSGHRYRIKGKADLR